MLDIYRSRCQATWVIAFSGRQKAMVFTTNQVPMCQSLTTRQNGIIRESKCPIWPNVSHITLSEGHMRLQESHFHALKMPKSNHWSVALMILEESDYFVAIMCSCNLILQSCDNRSTTVQHPFNNRSTIV